MASMRMNASDRVTEMTSTAGDHHQTSGWPQSELRLPALPAHKARRLPLA
jgi:hypothetical protein